MAKRKGVDFWRAFTGRSDRTERQGVRAQMADMERRHGGAAAAARAAGVNRGTWWRIKTGRTRAPRAATRQSIRAGHRQTLSTQGRRMRIQQATRPDRLRGAGPKVRGTWTVSADTRDRSVTIGSPEAREHIAEAEAAWLAGDDERAQAEVQQAIDLTVPPGASVEGAEIEW